MGKINLIYLSLQISRGKVDDWVTEKQTQAEATVRGQLCREFGLKVSLVL